jgi:hypothetical protein
MEHVEDHQRRGTLARDATTETRAQLAKVRASVRVKADELAVEDHAPPSEGFGERMQLRKLGGAITAGTRSQTEPRAVEPDLTTVPLDLGNLPVFLRRQRARPSEHRLDEARQILARRSRHNADDFTQQGVRLDASRRTTRPRRPPGERQLTMSADGLLGGAGSRRRTLSRQTPTSRGRSATAGRQVRARESPPGAGHAATGTRVALHRRPRLPARPHVPP